MKKLFKLSLIFLVFALTATCAKKKTGNLTITLIPDTMSLLNTASQSCMDLANPTNPPSYSAASSVALFQRMTATWKNEGKNLHLYGIRFTGKHDNLNSPIDITISGADFYAFAGTDQYSPCAFCDIIVFEEYTGQTKVTTAADSHTISIIKGAVYQPLDGTTVGNRRGCAPIIGGIAAKKDITSDFNIPLTVTLMGYSIGPDLKVNNEYAQAHVTLKYQAAPP